MKTKRRTLIVLLVFVLAAGAALALLNHANQKAELTIWMIRPAAPSGPRWQA